MKVDKQNSGILIAVGAVFIAVVVTVTSIANASRNVAGTMSNINGPYPTGTTINSTLVNARLADIENEETNSLSRDGMGGMRAALRGVDGTVAAPAFSFTSETGSGLYRIGASDLGWAISGAKKLELTSTLFTVTPAASFSSTLALADTLSQAKSGSAAGDAATFFEASLANGNVFALRLGKANTGASDAVAFYYNPNATAALSKGCLAVSGQTDTLCVDGNGKTTLGTTGTAISSSPRYTFSLAGVSLSASACTTQTSSCTDAAQDADCLATPNHSSSVAAIYGCSVRSAGTCTIQLCNPTTGGFGAATYQGTIRIFNP